MDEQTNNDKLINEYINTLAKKYNDVTLEVVTLQARVNLAIRDKEEAYASITDLQEQIDYANSEIDLLQNANKEVEVREVIKEIIKEVPVEKIVEIEKEGMPADEALIRENEYLKKELNTLEKKLKKLRQRQEEIADGGGT